MVNNEKNNNSKLSLWASFLWTLMWVIAVFFVFVYSVYTILSSEVQAIEPFIFAVVSLGFFIYTLLADIKKGKELRKAFYSHGKPIAESPIAEVIPGKREFYEKYRLLSKKRILCVCIYPVLMCVATVSILCISLFGQQWQSWSGLISTLVQSSGMFLAVMLCLIFPALLLLLWMTISVQRTLRLLSEAYDNANKEEWEALNKIQIREFTFLFTRKHFINWDGALHVIRLEDIKFIRYKRYFLLLAGGTRLVVTDSFGRKHHIWHNGPSVRQWDERGFSDCIKEGRKNGQVYIDTHLPM